jgi:hypothetical protein
MFKKERKMRKVLALSAAAGSAAVLQQQDSIFSWPELRKGIEERNSHEKQLRVIGDNARQRISELTNMFDAKKISSSEFDEKYHKLKKEITSKAQLVAWGAMGRDEYLKENGCVKINDASIQAIKKLNIGIVEMGAGSGHWAKALKDAGVDVIAFDSGESLPLVNDAKKFEVKQGNPDVLKSYRNRALLLVYPPPGPMAVNSLNAHESRVVIYCGEGIDGVNANREFFKRLESDFNVVTTITDFERFCEKSYERLWILKTKKV